MSSDTKSKTPDVRIMDLGKRDGLQAADAEELLRKIPIKLHSTPKMNQLFVARFIAEMPEEFENLKSLVREEKDLISIILKFNEFLAANGFDQNYDSSGVFWALCEAARS